MKNKKKPPLLTEQELIEDWEICTSMGLKNLSARKNPQTTKNPIHY